MNLKGVLQKDGMKWYNEEGPNNKKPAVKNRHFEEPTLNNTATETYPKLVFFTLKKFMVFSP